jgi:hypothetical protein
MANQPSARHSDIPSEELISAKKTVSAMIQSLKACALYPLTHENCQKAMTAAKQQLDDFLEQYDHLRIHIGQETILYQETPIHHETPNQGLFAAPLFRDGLEWVEFQKGIQGREFNGFLAMIMQYRTLNPEAEGDVVTALWEENYPHLNYEAKEAVWEAELADETAADLSFQMTLPTHSTAIPGVETPAGEEEADGGGEEGDGQESSGQAGHVPPPAPSLADATMDPALWQLTEEEKEILREMVYEEENFEGTDSVLDVLTILLKQESGAENGDRKTKASEDIVSILSFLKEEFQTTLDQGQIRLAFKLLKEIRNIRTAIEEQNPEAAALLDGFFLEISGPEVLAPLTPVWPRLDTLDPVRVKAFQQHLHLLHPVAVQAFAPVLLNGPSPLVRQMITDLIIGFAKTDPQPLEILLRSAGEPLVLELVGLLGPLKGEDFQKILLKLAEHPSATVRSKVLKTLLERDPYMLWRLFHHIEDQNPAVAGVIHGHLSRSKDKMAESLILDYLEEGQFKREERDHILTCYKTLGRCGSDHSVGFLEDLLLGSTYNDRFGGSLTLHREGAALALAKIGTPGAYKTLKKAGRSFSSKVRHAARQALESLK